MEILASNDDALSRKFMTKWHNNQPNGLGIKWVNGSIKGKYEVIYRNGKQVSEKLSKELSDDLRKINKFRPW